MKKIIITMILFTSSIWANSLTDGMLAMKQKNYDVAMKTFTKLAHEGNHIAQQNLGVMYNQGLGVKRNGIHAAYWFNVASGNIVPYEMLASN